MDQKASRAVKAKFGVRGLDEILMGGLTRNRLYLMEGAPGSGKTTLGLQFLLEGANAAKKAFTLHCRKLNKNYGRLRLLITGPSPRMSMFSNWCRLRAFWTKNSSKASCIRPTWS
jgi:replicative DNA helicase